MKISQKDFNPIAQREKWNSWTPAQKENYKKNLKRKMDFERSVRASKLEAQLRP